MALTAAQQSELQVRVGASGWAAYQALPTADQPDPAAALSVYGSLLLVAADILDAVATQARQAGILESQEESITLGPIKLVSTPVTTTASTQAAVEWARRAFDLRAQARVLGYGTRRSVSVTADTLVGL